MTCESGLGWTGWMDSAGKVQSEDRHTARNAISPHRMINLSLSLFFSFVDLLKSKKKSRSAFDHVKPSRLGLARWPSRSGAGDLRDSPTDDDD